MASAGAGGFANIKTAAGENLILDFFCQTPKSSKLTEPNYHQIDVDFGESIETFYTGPASMAVPGAMALIQYLCKHYCTIPITELIKPAQELATNGVVYTAFQAEDTLLLSNILLSSKKGQSLFTIDDQLITTGDNFRLSQYADFLESFSKEKPDWFYRGEIAESIANHSKDQNGYLRYEDFLAYDVKISQPFSFGFNNTRITTPSLPSMGGGLMQLFLQSFENKKFEAMSHSHFSILREAFANVIPFINDPEKLFNHLLKDQSSDDAYSGALPGGTSHLNIVDSLGNAIALSTSIGVGSGYFFPGTDMQMNNMLGEPALMPSGLQSWKEDVRLNSMMCPTLCFDTENNLTLMTGTGGSSRIPFSIAQLLINKYILKLNLDAAIALPRMFESLQQIYVEKGYDYDPSQLDKTIKEWDQIDLLFGGTHTIDLNDGQAVGDIRREGVGRVQI